MPDETTAPVAAETPAADETIESVFEQMGEAEAPAPEAAVTEAPEAEAPEAQESEAAPEAATEAAPPVDETARMAEFGKRVQDDFASNPVDTLARLAQIAMNSDPTFAAQLAAKLGVAAPAEAQAEDGDAFDPSTYEPASDLERELLGHYPVIREMPAFAEQVNSNFDAISLETRALKDRLDAIVEALDVRIPALDQDAVRAHPKWKTDPVAAYQETYGISLEKARKAAVQSRKARADKPATLSQQSAAPAPKKDYESIEEAYAAAGARLGLE